MWKVDLSQGENNICPYARFPVTKGVDVSCEDAGNDGNNSGFLWRILVSIFCVVVLSQNLSLTLYEVN